MSNIRNKELAPEGRKKIEWVRSFMPALSGIEKQFEETKPFKGLRIAVSVHLEAKTANLGLVLAKGGAEVYLTGCNPLSTQDDVAAAISEMGVETYGKYGVSAQEASTVILLFRTSMKPPPHAISSSRPSSYFTRMAHGMMLAIIGRWFGMTPISPSSALTTSISASIGETPAFATAIAFFIATWRRWRLCIAS